MNNYIYLQPGILPPVVSVKIEQPSTVPVPVMNEVLPPGLE